MKPRFPLAIAFFALAVFTFSGCASWIKVYAEAEPGVDLAQYYTYDWLENKVASPGDPAPYPLSRHAEEKIRNATDT